MPIYVWKGKNSYGESRKGEMEAPNEASVHVQLKKLRITPSKVKEKPKDILEDIPLFKPKVTTKDVIVFTRQLSTMIDAGLPLVQALDILAGQEPNRTFKEILREIQSDVETGSTFTEGMRKHPKFLTAYLPI